MSSYVLKNIIDQIETQLKTIDGGTDYNYTLNHNYIYKKFMTVDSVSGWPAVCISSARTSTEQADQITSEVSIEVEIFAYIQDSSPLDAIMNLCQDIEKSLFSDEKLGDCDVWNLLLSFNVASLDDFGMALITLTAKTVYEKPI